MKVSMAISFIVTSVVLSACAPASFTSNSNSPSNSTQTVPPSQTPAPSPTPSPTPTPDPLPVPTPAPLPQPVITSGICTQGQELTSCMNCQIPTPPPWVPSTKADKLAEIMFLSCGIHNESDAASYNPNQPTLLQIRSKLAACTAQALPETPLPSPGIQTINALLNQQDSSMRNRFFGGLWYQPPYTDYFEDYFGVESETIRRVLCYGADAASSLSGYDYTTPEAQACAGGGEGGSCDSWLANSSAQAAWQAVQNIRAQLRTCLEQSAALPPIPPFNPVCTYTTFSGYFQLGGAAELQKLEANPDMQVSVEYNQTCYNPKNLSSLPAITSGLVTISGYSCH